MPVDNSKYTLLIIISSFKEPEKIIQLLTEAHFQVLRATNPQEAVKIIHSDSVDLVLMDIDGDTQLENSIIQELKKNKTVCLLPFMLLTSITDESIIPESLAYDNVDFVTKPFCTQELIIRIQRQLLLLRAQRTIRKQNKKLKDTLEARDKLYSVIAHDLRAPIGTIKMINSAIENKKAKIQNPDIRRFFEMINETTEEAFNLLENLLRWTRNQNGKTKVYATCFNISKAIRQVASLFSTIAEAKNIKIYNTITENITVYADEDMVKTVLRNLLSNAVKFTYPGGKIDIGVLESSDCIQISVKDNGKGIPKDLQSKLLKPNQYITTYGTRNEKGSGLGLVLSQEFIKINKGKFWFSSQEGVGTTFFFTIPLSPSEN